MKAVSKMSSPIPVEVYTPAYFKKNPAPNIFESLQMVNGVQPQLNCNVCNTGDIHINGMEGPYTMILIDGMPIVSSLSTVYGLAGIPNSMVKRIEIVKGPASTLYGSEAVGGLINIITKDALISEKLRMDISASHIGELNADLTTAHVGKRASTLLGINYFNFNRRLDINNDNFTDLTLQNRVSVFNKWNFKGTGDFNASLGVRVIYENRWGGELNWNKKYRGSDSIYGETIDTKRAELVSTVNAGQGVSIDISYNYHLQDSYYGTIKYYATQQVAFAQLRWNKKFGKHDLLTGVPFRYTYYDDNTPTTGNIDGTNKPQQSFLPGVFIQDEYKANQSLTVLGGMRYDHNNEHGNIFTPRLSLKYSPDNSNAFRLSFGNGYRVVNLFTEDHAALTGARDVVIAANLKPEQSWNANVNYTAMVRHENGFINIDLSGFYTYFTNKIIGDYFTDPRKIIYDNLDGYAISKGITVNSDASFTNGFKIIAGITLMDVYDIKKDTYGKRVKSPQLFAPSFSGTFAISYALPKQKLGIDLTGRINGPMFLPVVPNDFRNAKSPLYGIINLQVTHSIKTQMELYAGVKNLLNFLPINPLLHPDDPFNKRGGKYFDNDGKPRPDTNPYNYVFDTSYNYAPMQGAKLYAGIRYQLK
jgi:outer membrane receptor for ferrienterochelin and colicins